MLDSIYEKTQVLIRRILILPGRAEIGRQQHVAMLEAMCRGDAELAERLRRESLRSAQESPRKIPEVHPLEPRTANGHRTNPTQPRTSDRPARRVSRHRTRLDGRRPLLRAPARRFRRRGDQGRARRGRRGAHHGQALPRQVALRREHLPQQVADRGRPAPARGPEDRRRPGGEERRAGREFPPRRPREVGPGLRRRSRRATPDW